MTVFRDMTPNLAARLLSFVVRRRRRAPGEIAVEFIPNARLRPVDLPDPQADWAAIWRLADTFNGFKHWGSFERCAEVANAERHSTLTELRTCLFFECRRWHHYGEEPDEEASPYIRGLVAKIRNKVAAGEWE